MKQVVKYSIPDDGERHKIGDGHIIYMWGVSREGDDVVEVWVEVDFDFVTPPTIEAELCRTGRTYSDNGTARGTAMMPVGNGLEPVHLITFYDGPPGYIKRS